MSCEEVLSAVNIPWATTDNCGWAESGYWWWHWHVILPSLPSSWHHATTGDTTFTPPQPTSMILTHISVIILSKKSASCSLINRLSSGWFCLISDGTTLLIILQATIYLGQNNSFHESVMAIGHSSVASVSAVSSNVTHSTSHNEHKVKTFPVFVATHFWL